MKNPRATYRLLLLLLLGTVTLSAHAQGKPFKNIMYQEYDIREYGDIVMQCIARQMAARQDNRQVLPFSPYIQANEGSTWWTDGHYLYEMYYDVTDRTIYFNLFSQPSDDFDPPSSLKVKGNKVTVADNPRHTCNVERLGNLVMLVMRDANGVPVKALYKIEKEDWYNGNASLLVEYLFMGCYDFDGSKPEELVVFGPHMQSYNCSPYFSADPGFYGIEFGSTPHSIKITYGGGRISRGNPSTRDSQMRGEGGRGAIMGPMEWSITPTVEGLQVRIVRDEPYVDHLPAIGKEGDEVTLTKVACPFQDLPGKWAFASVIPLTHTLLKLFPKEVLTLMRGEIYARHGDTFKDPATQRYFDAQPWYKPTGRPVQLTDLERFNYQLIKHVETSMH